MEKFERLDAVAMPINAANVDTDQIVPARFLRKPRKAGFAPYLFHDLRFGSDGGQKPDFALNQEAWRQSRIVVADKNFACGSSREAAVWALYDYGFRAAIAPSFGDIFFNNSFKNGFLPIVMPADEVAGLRRQLTAKPGSRLAVDLAAQTVTAPDGTTLRFEIDAARKHRLLAGVDDIGYTLTHADAIAAFEKRHAQALSWA